MKQQKRNMEIIGDHSFFLSHELRRPLANVVAIFELLKSEGIGEKDHSSQSLLLKKALADFDEVIAKYHRAIAREK